ncbi:MAG: B12-binding domain-containing radical SAM protein [Clostridia bacterium]|nr:B12-binding domain-containing radical SAM protein [Clostridia bacterium]
MKKVAICVLNSKYIHSSLAPWCLYTSAKKYCGESCSFSVVEGTVNEDIDGVFARIMAEEPSAVTFTCYIWNIKQTLGLCRKIKEADGRITVVLGGPEVAYNQREILTDNPFIDYVFSGEGEVILPEFLNGKAEDVKGVSFMKDGKVHISQREDAQTADYPSPYCEEYFASLKGRIAYIESSRGCPFSCAFCLSGRCGKVRFFPMDRVKGEILSLACCGAKTVKFVDRTFNCNLDRAKEILSFIKKSYGKEIPDDVCFHFEIAAHITDEEFMTLIKSMPAGSVQFEAGIQSFNAKTLEAIGRSDNTEKICESIERLASFGNCHIHIDLIAGLPQEDYTSFVDGFNRAYALRANMLQLGFLKILHGSPMGGEREKYPCHYSKEPPYEVISTPWISAEELENLRKAENELERLSNSGRFTCTLDYIFGKSDITPFDLFYSLAIFLDKKGKRGSIPLDEYTCLVYDFLSSLDCTDERELRDAMLYDRVATNNSGVIPERLKVADERLKKAAERVRELSPPGKGVNRTVAILYTESRIIWCDYRERDRVSGRYKVESIPFTET